MKTLLCWIGLTDLRAAEEKENVGLGPIAQAVQDRSFSSIVLLADKYEQGQAYRKWLAQRTPAKISVVSAKLTTPTDFGEIYRHASLNVQDLVKSGVQPHQLVFHISPGTPAMAAVWIILAKTRFPAELIESSKQKGVRTVSVPFDISAEFIPDLLRKPDEDLVALAQGLAPEAPEFGDIIHQSPTMKAVILKARKVAPRNIPVLIEGESGTGKELLATAIHNASPRRNSAFVAINCGAIPSELIDSELFGHKKGSFTGAATDHDGYLAQAHGGTLFLDEIGELPLNAQVKLLRALQQGEVRAIGSKKVEKVDVRIIAATNRDLLQEVAENRFREDLFHRLAVAVLHLPPLRERGGDLGLLIERLLKRINQEASSQPGYQDKSLSPGGKNVLLNHSWPGNVRELINTLQRAAVWSTGPRIEEKDARDALLRRSESRDDILHRSLGEGFSLQGLLDEVAIHYLRRAVTESNHQKVAATKLLGFNNYQTLNNWLEKYDVKI